LKIQFVSTLKTNDGFIHIKRYDIFFWTYLQFCSMNPCRSRA